MFRQRRIQQLDIGLCHGGTILGIDEGVFCLREFSLHSLLASPPPSQSSNAMIKSDTEGTVGILYFSNTRRNKASILLYQVSTLANDCNLFFSASTYTSLFGEPGSGAGGSWSLKSFSSADDISFR